MNRVSLSKALGGLMAIAGLLSVAWGETSSFSLQKVMDSVGTGKVALTYLLPKGWTASDQVNWNPKRRLAPMFYVLDEKSADGLSEVAYLSGGGSHYAKAADGKVTGIPPFAKPSDVLITEFKDQFDKSPYQIVSQKDTPTPLTAGAQQAFTSSVELRFTLKGVSCLYKGQMQYRSTSSGSTSAIWTIRNAFSVSGPEATFPGTMHTAEVMFSSQKVDPRFFEEYLDIAEAVGKTESPNADALLAGLDAEYKQGLSDTHQLSFKTYTETGNQAILDFFPDLAGRARMGDGNTTFILPPGFATAFAGDDGQYLLIGAQDAKPSTGNWKPLGTIN